jgi:hypothetical protein
VSAAKSNARRLREQDGGILDLRRQSLRQHGLLHDNSSVQALQSESVSEETRGAPMSTSAKVNEETVRAESKRRKEEAKVRELEEFRRAERERNSLWNWIRGK